MPAYPLFADHGLLDAAVVLDRGPNREPDRSPRAAGVRETARR